MSHFEAASSEIRSLERMQTGLQAKLRTELDSAQERRVLDDLTYVNQQLVYATEHLERLHATDI